jgi:hypothetical protein
LQFFCFAFPARKTNKVPESYGFGGEKSRNKSRTDSIVRELFYSPISAQHRTAAQAARSPICALAGPRWEYREETKMREATNVTKPMREAAKEAETALRLANEICGRIRHEDIDDNQQLVMGVMLAITQSYNAISIRDAIDDVASAIRENCT